MTTITTPDGVPSTGNTRPYELDAFGPRGVLINGHRVRRVRQPDGMVNYLVTTPGGFMLGVKGRRKLEAIIGGGATCAVSNVVTNAERKSR